MKYYSYLFSLILLIAHNSFGQKKLPHSKKEKIDNILSFFPTDEPGGTFLITQKSKFLYQKAIGKANLELDINMKIDNVLGIASVTKPFTAIAILKLVEDNKISLDDHITKFLPNFLSKRGHIKIKHLLSHTSGLPYISLKERKKLENKMKGQEDEKITSFFSDKEFRFSPGTQYQYSNEGYLILGYIIQKVTGKLYGEYLNDIYFTPLQMKDTKVQTYSLVIKNRSSEYDSFGGKPYINKEIHYGNNSFPSAGGLVSSVTDLSVWYNAVMNHEIINKNSLKTATAPITYPNGTTGTNSIVWELGNLNGYDYIWHDGLSWGNGAIVIYFPKINLFIGHLRNCGYCKYDRNLSYSAAIRAAAVILNSEYLNKAIPVTTSIATYEGMYESGTTEKKVIITEENDIYLKSNGNFLRLQYLNKDTFFIERNNETIQFKKDKKGRITGLLSTIGKPVIYQRIKKSPKKSLSLFLNNYLKQKTSENNIIAIAINKMKDKNYEMNETEINNLGYSYFNQKKINIARQLFELNIKLYPNSANAYDSLGEILFYNGNYSESLINYKKALELNPSSNSAKNRIKEIQKLKKH